MKDPKRRAVISDRIGWMFAVVAAVWLVVALVRAVIGGDVGNALVNATAVLAGCLAMRAHAEVQRLQARVGELEAARGSEVPR